MAGYDLPIKAIREQIASALNIIMHVDRMPDGRRVVTSVTELQGMEGDIILLQDIFNYRPPAVGQRQTPAGELVATGPAAQVPRQAGRGRASRCRPTSFQHRRTRAVDAGVGRSGPQHAAPGRIRAGQHGAGPVSDRRCSASLVREVGAALIVAGILLGARERERQLADILDLPFGERDVPPRGRRSSQPAGRQHRRPGQQGGRPVRRQGRPARRPRAGPHPDAPRRVRPHLRRRWSPSSPPCVFGR